LSAVADTVSTNQFKNGMHIELDGGVWRIVEFQHVKPGKGGAFVRTKVKNAAQLLKTGAVTEVSINSDQVLTVMRLVTDEYFVVLALKASGNYGKGRYALRIVAPRIRAEL